MNERKQMLVLNDSLPVSFPPLPPLELHARKVLMADVKERRSNTDLNSGFQSRPAPFAPLPLRELPPLGRSPMQDMRSGHSRAVVGFLSQLGSVSCLGRGVKAAFQSKRNI